MTQKINEENELGTKRKFLQTHPYSETIVQKHQQPKDEHDRIVHLAATPLKLTTRIQINHFNTRWQDTHHNPNMQRMHAEMVPFPID